jgi:hypothetical protein
MFEMMIHFTGGGPLDGKDIASDSDPDFGPSQARWIGGAVGAVLDAAEKKENAPGTLFTWCEPSASDAERALMEGWSEAKKRALMKYHVYDVAEYAEGDGVVSFTARYRGLA